MSIFPQVTETIISGDSCDSVTVRLHEMIEEVDPRTMKVPGTSERKFSGMFVDNTWQFTRSVRKPSSYQPMVHLRLEPAGNTCLVTIRYALFTDTKRSLVIWSLLSLFAAAFFMGLYQEWLYGALCLSFGLVHYILTRENFRIQLRSTRRLLHEMLFPSDQ